FRLIMYEEECKVVHELSLSFEYQFIVAIRAILLLLAVFRIVSQWRAYGLRFLLHENTKILFGFYYCLNIFTSFLSGIMFLLELIRLRFDCVLIDFRYVLMTKCLGISSIIAAHHVIVILSFERLYSSIFPAHFER
ncbi:hypothetical protein PMAYCL1PPCAC_11451, partial [Pristionchus mayeri]